MRKLVFGVSDRVRYKPGCTFTEGWVAGLKFWIRDCTIYAAKTKAQISCVVNAQQICLFVFANANGRFSHDAAQIMVDDISIDCHRKVV